jgi:formylglycine-generating enzyme required for sulfatase activity
MGCNDGFLDENKERVVEIKEPFYIGQLEVTNEQFAQFNPEHDSRYIDGRGKDRRSRGYPINGPKFPAVRMTWKQATAFCEWLSEKTGHKCSLPTEEQWEYACRAGAGGPLPRAKKNRTSYQGGRDKPNAWRIIDMTGNVAEWTTSKYDAGAAKEFQDAGQVAISRVVRGSTWDDKLSKVPTTFRWRYPIHQPVYNVGFRVACEIPAGKKVVSRK